jgi:hypothetical protein
MHATCTLMTAAFYHGLDPRSSTHGSVEITARIFEKEWTGMKNVPLLIASQAIPSLSFVKIQNGSYSHAFGRRSNSASVIVAVCL